MSGRRSGRYRSDIEALLRVLVLVLDRLCDSGSKPEGQSPETVREPLWHGLGLVAAHDRYTPQQSAQRDQKIAELEAQALLWAEKRAGYTHRRFCPFRDYR